VWPLFQATPACSRHARLTSPLPTPRECFYTTIAPDSARNDLWLLVTGAGSGIGLAITHSAAAAGYNLVIVDRSADALSSAEDELSSEADVRAFVADVTGFGQLTDGLAKTRSRREPLTAVAHSAGSEVLGAVDEIDPADWAHCINVNLTGSFNTAHAAMPELLATRGALTFVASDAGLTGAQGHAAYCAAKHGVVGLMRAMDLDYGPRGVRVNAVAPSFVETPMADRIFSGYEGERDFYKATVPLGRFAQPAALCTRWRQLKCWLRSLTYVELRALQGTKRLDASKAANPRLEQDALYTHMAGPDSDNPLAYLDYSQLLELIERFWDQVGYALFEKASWQGRQVEPKRIRHRIGHMRRPHLDDLGRLEQVLRDLERGTFRALSTYNDRCVPDVVAYDDAVTQGWVRGAHDDARRLLTHADRRYETRIRVTTSARDRAERSPASIAGTPGHL
jgi:NAD(P)-dependent dehydrogenase (short-subunit alcohol dehydrogenase family)